LDPVAYGQKAGQFAVSAGAGGYDLVFNDVADRDAGYYEHVVGRNEWWDRLNIALPNFTRWEQYLGAVTSTIGKSAMVWQIPLGNQWFDTENNTDGHYQDNRAEYFFGHLGELQQAGVIGVMFGAGAGGPTTNSDDKGDGITNPASFCTTRGVSSGQVCNSHTSTVSDDDGGYLRMASANYYQNPIPLGGGSPPPPSDTTPPNAPVVSRPATTVTVSRATKAYSVTGTAETAALVRVWVDANGNGRKDAGEALAGSLQLRSTATSWTVKVTLAHGPNQFVVTATDAAGNESAAALVPVITRK
jgi:hypothetical protein